LIGRPEQGGLGRRWFYDATGDPVFVAQLVALIQGEAEPQAQGLSNTPDPTVTGTPVSDVSLKVTGSAVVASGQAGTDLRIETAANDSGSSLMVVRVQRILRPADGAGPSGEAGRPCLSAIWRLPDGTPARGVFATARYTPRSPARS
jgi:hypothetical protein